MLNSGSLIWGKATVQYIAKISSASIPLSYSEAVMVLLALMVGPSCSHVYTVQ